jgi:hypothetical protein
MYVLLKAGRHPTYIVALHLTYIVRYELKCSLAQAAVADM